MDSKVNRQLVRHVLTVIALSTIATACGQPVDQVTLIRQKNLMVKEVIRSQSNAGGQIQINHRLPQTLMAGQEAAVVLSFQLDPWQHLEIDIKESEDFKLVGDTVAVLEGSASGLIEMNIHLVPVHAGKSYLKLIAATVDGEKIRPYAIRLNVADQAGHLPDQQRILKSRINLPSASQ